MSAMHHIIGNIALCYKKRVVSHFEPRLV